MKLTFLALVALALSAQSSGGVNPQLTVTTSSLASGTIVNLSAANTGWAYFGQVAGHDYTGHPFDCTAGLLNNTQNPCHPGAYKLGGSGITPLYALNTGVGTSNDGRVYGDNGPNPSAVTWLWTDSAGTASGSSSKLFQVVGANAIQQIAFASDPVLKTADVYVYNWNPYAGAGGCFSGAGTFHSTIHATDASFADKTIVMTSSQGDCSGAKKITLSFATATSSYITVSLDQAAVDVNTSLIAAALNGPPITANTRVVPQAIELFGALFAAARGETLAFADGYTYDGHLTLPPKPDVLDESNNPLWITAQWGKLPYTNGIRIALSDRATTPTLTSHDTDPVLVQSKGSNHYTFDGFSFASNNPNANGLIYALIVITPPLTVFGSHSSLLATQTIADLPVGLNLLHCIVHGRDASEGSQFNQTRGIVADGVDVTIQDSVVDNWQYNTMEANAILIQVGKNVRVINSEVEASGEAIMIHNAAAYDDTQAGLVPVGGGLYADGTVITHCYVHKNYHDWIQYTLAKNIIENKTGKNTTITHNLLEDSFESRYSDGQHGIAIGLQARNAAHHTGEYPGDETNGHPWAVSKNIDVSYNIIRHVGGCVGTVGLFDDSWGTAKLAAALASGATAPNSDFNIHHNHCEDVSGSLFTALAGSLPTIRPSYPGFGMRSAGPNNFSFSNNTILFREQYTGQVMPSGNYKGIPYNAYTVPGFSSNGSNAGMFIPDKPKGSSAGFHFINQVWDSNVVGFDLLCDADDGAGACFRDAANETFTNNTFLYNEHAATRTSGFAALNAAYPGHYAGNLFNSNNVSSRGAPTAALFAQECSIRTGNHPGVACTNPPVPTY